MPNNNQRKEPITAQSIMERWNRYWDDWEVRIRELVLPDGTLYGYTAYDLESAALLQKHVGAFTWTAAEHEFLLAPLYEAGYCTADMSEVYAATRKPDQ